MHCIRRHEGTAVQGVPVLVLAKLLQMLSQVLLVVDAENLKVHQTRWDPLCWQTLAALPTRASTWCGAWEIRIFCHRLNARAWNAYRMDVRRTGQ